MNFQSVKHIIKLKILQIRASILLLLLHLLFHLIFTKTLWTVIQNEVSHKEDRGVGGMSWKIGIDIYTLLQTEIEESEENH